MTRSSSVANGLALAVVVVAALVATLNWSTSQDLQECLRAAEIVMECRRAEATANLALRAIRDGRTAEAEEYVGQLRQQVGMIGQRAESNYTFDDRLTARD